MHVCMYASAGIVLPLPKQQESTEAYTPKGKTLDIQTQMLSPTWTKHHGVNTWDRTYWFKTVLDYKML